MRTVKIFLVDDHQVIRDGLRALLEQNKYYKVVGESSCGKEALEKVRHVKPDVVFLDLTMAGMNGMETAREFKSEFPDIRVVILSMHNDLEYIGQCMDYDVMGYVVKNDGGKEVVKAVESVMQDKKYYSDAVAQAIMEKYRQQKKEIIQTKRDVIEITNRERQVIEYISKGFTNQRIADQLFISFRTVETHRANLMRKLEARNSIELVNKAREQSLVA
jgi:two-component system nitrate/nitrite response regulator NarL